MSRSVLIVGMFTRAEPVEHLLDLGPRLPRARREPRDDWKEPVAPQRLQLKLADRPNHGRTRHPAQ